MTAHRKEAPHRENPGGAKAKKKINRLKRSRRIGPHSQRDNIQRVKWTDEKSHTGNRLQWEEDMLLDPTLTPGWKCVLVQVSRHVNLTEGFAWPAQDTLANLTAQKVKTATRALIAGEDRGWIKSEWIKGRKCYFLTYNERWRDTLRRSAEAKKEGNAAPPTEAKQAEPEPSERTHESFSERTHESFCERTHESHYSYTETYTETDSDSPSVGGESPTCSALSPREAEPRPERPPFDPAWLDPENPFLNHVERVLAVCLRAGVKVEWAA